MKKLILSALTVLAMIACSNPLKQQVAPELFNGSISLNSPTNGSLVFDATGGEGSISFSTNGDWYAYPVNSRAESWCKISPSAGKAGNSEIKVILAENPEKDDLNASIVIACGSAQQVITIVEKPKDAIIITSSKVEIAAEGGTANVSVKANTNYTASVEESAAEWLSIAALPTKGSMEPSTFTVSAITNPSPKVRQGVVTVTAGEASERVVIYQKGTDPVLTLLTDKEIDVPYTGTTFKVEIQSNLDVTYSLSDGCNWIAEQSTKAVSTNTYNFVVSANSTAQFRDAEIVFSSTDSDLKETVKIHQTTADGKDRTSISILAIGNSFSVDAMEYLYPMLKDIGYNKISLGNLYIGGCTLQTHATNFKDGKAAYTYYTNTSNTWSNVSSYNALNALNEKWDYISIQQASGYSGVPSSYDPYLAEIIAIVKQKNPDAQIMWHMTWAYQSNSTHSDFPKYGQNQMTMYNSIVSTVKEKVLTQSDIKFVIPSGTAIQNLRTSYLGDTMTRDGYHMSYDVGRTVTAMTWASKITGASVDKIKTLPSGYTFDTQKINAMKDAVKKAIDKPFEITESAYPPQKSKPDEAVRKLFTDAGYKLDEYNELEFTYTLKGFWQSTANSTINTTASNSNQFTATQMWTKSDLPVGTVIVVKNGYQYRPEGWKTLTTVNSSSARPGNVTTQIVVVNSAWWGDWNYRAFNLAKVGNPALSDAEQALLPNCIGIFVPKK